MEEATNRQANKTSDQIYTEVAQAFGLNRNQLAYFRIFGQDRVQYNDGPGATYAYNAGNGWVKALSGAQAAPLCNQLSQVPERYRPVCITSGNTYLYADSNNQSVNYPLAQAVHYIGD